MQLFHTFENRYTIECTLHSEESLHIGAGVEGEASDAAFLSRDGVPYIPGSTLRGVLRSSLERLLHSLSPPGQAIACTLFVPEGDKSIPQPDCATKKDKDYAKPENWDNFQKRLRLGEIGFCPMCHLFGSTLIAGRIKFTDAVQGKDPGRIEVRDGVGIDRDTGAAREAIKFTFDALNPGCTFTGQIHLENVTGEDRALVHMILSLLKHGVDIGGKRGRGFGLVKLTNFTVRGISGKEQLKNFLMSGAMPQIGDFETSTRSHFEQFWSALSNQAS